MLLLTFSRRQLLERRDVVGGKARSQLNADEVVQLDQELDRRVAEFRDRVIQENLPKALDEVERQHPYSVWARRAILMSAYCHYQGNKYNDAILAADRFITLLNPSGGGSSPQPGYADAIAQDNALRPSPTPVPYWALQQAVTAIQAELDRLSAAELARRGGVGVSMGMGSGCASARRDRPLRVACYFSVALAPEMNAARFWMSSSVKLCACARMVG